MASLSKTANPSTTIESLPGEVLVHIFHALPWRDRMCGAEAVCKAWRELMRTRGWSDVRRFNNKDLFLQWGGHHPTVGVGPFLDRFGANLESLIMDEKIERQVDLLAELRKCPKLLHLSLNFRSVKPAAIEHVRRAYAPTLKSLCIESDFWGEASVHALGESLRQFASLECLWIDDHWKINLRLPPGDLVPCLRNVNMQCRGIYASLKLCAWNIEALTSYPQLRSLTTTALKSDVDLSFLERLTRLEHLRLGYIDVSQRTGSLIKALPHMAGSLKALEVWAVKLPSLKSKGVCPTEQLFTAIATNVPQLEHFGLLHQFGSFTQPMSRVLSRMERLRSLEMNLNYFRPTDWQWLGEMTRLEHLKLSPKPPHRTTCELIRNCKNLRCLEFGDYKPSTQEQAALVKAAAVVSDVEKEGGTRGLSSANQPPLLIIHVAHGWKCDEEITEGSRLRFTDRDGLGSHVLHAYKYRHLIEGKPDFAE